jgi:Helitron helicase-like domain at N-terminus
VRTLPRPHPHTARRPHDGPPTRENAPAGPRYYADKLLNLLVAAGKYGTNNVLFVTVTASPSWEFMRDLLDGQRADDRPDVVVRAFDIVRQQVTLDLEAGVYCPADAKATADYYAVATELQKRGLPHFHSVHHYPGRSWSARQVDEVSWTHVPTDADERRFPGVRALVLQFMLHSHSERCGFYRTGHCCWRYPQPPVAETYCDANGKWHTWRRAGELEQRVVPYNPTLLTRLNCHACVMVTSGTTSIGYLLQYNCKGDATIRAKIAEAREECAERGCAVDEVQVFQTHRVVGASEAMLRVDGHRMIIVNPPVTTIRIVLPEHRAVFYNRARTTQEMALAAYESDVDLFFQRPDELREVRTYAARAFNDARTGR